MSGADEARDLIHKAARAVYAPVHAAGVAYVKAHQATLAETDVVKTMQQAVALIVSAEHLKDMAAEAEGAARSILAETMNDTGCTQIDAETIRVHLSRKPAFVSVDQEDLVPPEYMHQPPPTLDKKKIKAAIEAGEDVPGCTLARPNAMQLNLRSKKE